MNKQRFRIVVDMLMVILMPMLMAYILVGEKLHELMGIAIFILFIIHHALNIGWYKSLMKGRYNFHRILMLVINIALVIIMFLLPISGIMMSRYMFTFLNAGNMLMYSRKIHLVLSYWGIVLMSLHLGMHWGSIKRRISKTEGSVVKKIIENVVVVGVMCYGCVTFCLRHFTDYMFLKVHFVFFNFSESLLLYLIDMVSVMILFAGIGYYILEIEKRLRTGSGRR